MDDTVELASTEEVSHDGITALDDETRRTIFRTGRLAEDIWDVRHHDDTRFALAGTLVTDKGVRSVGIDILIQLDVAVQERASVSHTTARLDSSVGLEVGRSVDTVVEGSHSSGDVRRDDREVTATHTSRKGYLARHGDDRVHDTTGDTFSGPTTHTGVETVLIGEVDLDSSFTTESRGLGNEHHGLEDFTVDVLLDFELETFEEKGFNVLAVSGSHILLEFDGVVRLDSASTNADSTRDHLDGGFLDVEAVGTVLVVTSEVGTTEVVVEETRRFRIKGVAVGGSTANASAFHVVGKHFAHASRPGVERASEAGMVSHEVVADFLLLTTTEGGRLQRFVIVEVTESEVDTLRGGGRDNRNRLHREQFRELTANHRESVLLVLGNVGGDVGSFEQGATVQLVLVFQKGSNHAGFSAGANRTTKVGFKNGTPLIRQVFLLKSLHISSPSLLVCCASSAAPTRHGSERRFLIYCLGVSKNA